MASNILYISTYICTLNGSRANHSQPAATKPQQKHIIIFNRYILPLMLIVSVKPAVFYIFIIFSAGILGPPTSYLNLSKCILLILVWGMHIYSSYTNTPNSFTGLYYILYTFYYIISGPFLLMVLLSFFVFFF